MPCEVTLLDPARRFIALLDAKLKVKTLRTIDLLAEFGSRLSMPYARKLTGRNLWELRRRTGNTSEGKKFRGPRSGIGIFR